MKLKKNRTLKSFKIRSKKIHIFFLIDKFKDKFPNADKVTIFGAAFS